MRKTPAQSSSSSPLPVVERLQLQISDKLVLKAEGRFTVVIVAAAIVTIVSFWLWSGA